MAEGDAGNELMLMLLADARLPVGAHTQSGGLEAALRAGMTIAEVPRYLAVRLDTVATVEAAAAVLARHHALPAVGVPHPDDTAPAVQAAQAAVPSGVTQRSGQADVQRTASSLRQVDDAWRARTPSPALRGNSELMGRGLARLARRLWPGHAAVAALETVTHPVRPVVLGVAAAAAGLTARQLVRLVAYDDLQTVASAALKLHPMDPADATAWVIAAQQGVERMVSALSTMTTTDELPAASAPLIEQWAQAHATAPQRLFRA